MRIAAVTLLALAGCASSPPPAPRVLTPDLASRMPVADLCWGLSNYRPENAATAQMELERRGVNCADHAASVQAIDQQRAQALGILLSNQPTYRYQPYQVPAPAPTVHCRTIQVYNTLQTSCN